MLITFQNDIVTRAMRSILVPLLASLPLLILTACDNPELPPPAIDQQTITLRFGHDMPEGNPHHTAALHFAQLVEQASQGQVKITVHPAQSLGTDHEMVAMAQAGELDIVLPPTAKLSSFEPAFQIMDLPFIFHNREEAHRILDGPTGQALFKKLQPLGLTGVDFWESGFKQLTVDRPVSNIHDLKGLKFRVMRSGVLRDQFMSWGVDTIAIDFARTHKALAEGIVNGHENPLNTIYHMKFHEVQSHLILTNHGYISQVLLFSNKSLAKLPLKLQELLLDCGHKASQFQRDEAAKAEKHSLEKIRQGNITVLKLNDKTRQQLIQKSRIVMEKHRNEIGTEIIEQTLQTLDEHRTIDKDKLLIALDADMAGNSAISGLAIRRGIELAIHEINTAGGILGKQLHLIARDNSMVSARGIDNLQRFAKHPNLVAVFGGISSPVVLSELDFIHNNKILFLDPWAAATHIVDNHYKPNYVFRISVRDEYAARFLLHKAIKNTRQVALLFANNEWGRSNHTAIKHEMLRLGLQPMTEQWFDWGDNKLDSKIDDIARSGAKTIIYVGNAVEAAKIIKYIDNQKLNLSIVSHWGIAGGDLPKLAGPALERVKVYVLQTFSFINNPHKRTQDLIKLYKQLYAIEKPEDIVAPVGTAHAYDLMHLLARAIRKSGRTDMPSIRTAMETLGPYSGLVRRYQPAFTPGRHDALDQMDYFLASYQNGILVPGE